MLTEVLRGFPLSLEENAGIVLLLPSKYFPISHSSVVLSSNFMQILDTESVVEQFTEMKCLQVESLVRGRSESAIRFHLRLLRTISRRESLS
jgi:hypothetical protein